MEQVFVKAAELKLVNGGYLVTGEKETPVSHQGFMDAQLKARWLITLAEKAEGKDFEGKVAYTKEALMKEVSDELNAKLKQFVVTPEAPKQTISEKLKLEALSFIDHQDEVSTNETLNAYLNSFKIIDEFEEFGLYFTKEVTKLDRIYTMAEVIKAAKAVIHLI